LHGLDDEDGWLHLARSSAMPQSTDVKVSNLGCVQDLYQPKSSAMPII
jgi:hypothetical protein